MEFKSRLFGRRFNSAGIAQNTQFADQHLQHREQLPGPGARRVDADGDFVVVWESCGQDVPATGVFARRFTPPAPPRPTSCRSTSSSSAIRALPTSPSTPAETSWSPGPASTPRSPRTDTSMACSRGASGPTVRRGPRCRSTPSPRRARWRRGRGRGRRRLRHRLVQRPHQRPRRHLRPTLRRATSVRRRWQRRVRSADRRSAHPALRLRVQRRHPDHRRGGRGCTRCDAPSITAYLQGFV